MNGTLKLRKSPWNLAARTGWNSRRILTHTSTSNHSMSIHHARSIAKMLFGWVREAQRLHKLWMETGREIHAIALKRHLAGIAEYIWRYC
jgi:hypothetical protein